MANVDFSHYKRLVRAFWDPEPRNDDLSGSCIWCLGKNYTPQLLLQGTTDRLPSTHQEASSLTNGNGDLLLQGGRKAPPNIDDIPSDGPHDVESEAERGWPPQFLDDCESRIWLTYRSNFPAIRKSSDASMSLSVRLRSLGDQTGFTSDTGWGCMIRSGQSLLANALLMLQLGRGMLRVS